MMDTLVGNRFRTHRRLGSGSFGEIFIGIDQATGTKVAMKFERQNLRCPQLRHEFKVYRELKGCKGICNVTHYGTHLTYNVMVLELLGPSLEELFTRCGRKFSLKTTLKLADQMLERVETLHSRHLIHRDIKPANFVMSADSSSMVYCIDFGLSKRYRNPHTLQHISFRTGKSLTGTPRYASVNNHQGIEQSRRDDLEAVGYVLVYFLKGRLPWQGLKAKSAHRKYKLILGKKMEIPIMALCHDCPPQFAEYLSYCRSLSFDKDPDIAYLRGLFRGLYKASGYINIEAQDWDWLPARSSQQERAAAAQRELLAREAAELRAAKRRFATSTLQDLIPSDDHVFIDPSQSGGPDSNPRATAAAMGIPSTQGALGSGEPLGPTTTAALPSGSADARIASTTASPLPNGTSTLQHSMNQGIEVSANNQSIPGQNQTEQHKNEQRSQHHQTRSSSQQLRQQRPSSEQLPAPPAATVSAQQQQQQQSIVVSAQQQRSYARPTTASAGHRATTAAEVNEVSRQSSTSQRLTGGKRGAPASFAGSERAGRRPSIEGNNRAAAPPAQTPSENRDPYQRSGGGRYELRRPRSAVNYRVDARGSPSAAAADTVPAGTAQKAPNKWATKAGLRSASSSARDVTRSAAPAPATTTGSDPRLVASARGVMSMARNGSVSSRGRRSAAP